MTEKQRKEYIDNMENWEELKRESAWFRTLRLTFKGLTFLRTQALVTLPDWRKSIKGDVKKIVWMDERIYQLHTEDKPWLEPISVTLMRERMKAEDISGTEGIK